MGDKTQLAVFTLVAQHQSNADFHQGRHTLTTVSLIGASSERRFEYVPTEYLQVVAGLLFVGMGIVILIRAFGNIIV